VQTAIRFIVSGLILLGIIGFMTTYTVRFTDSAVLSTFGKADESSIQTTPGLRFKLPYPIQSVTTYDTRARFVESRPETQQTADDRQIILSTFLTYRVTNPLAFYKLFSESGSSSIKHYEKAEKVLSSRLREAMGQTSKYRFSQLFNQAAGGRGLIELEDAIRTNLIGADGGAAIKAYGIEVLSVGISSTKLPEETSKAVAGRMTQTRQKLAQEALSRGEAEKNKIKTQADADARKIMDFASRKAKTVQAQGELEAKPYVERLNADPQLAVFLKNIEMMRESMARKFTLVLPVSMPGMGVFTPDAMGTLRNGQIPGAPASPPAPAATAKPAGPAPAAPAPAGSAPAGSATGGGEKSKAPAAGDEVVAEGADK